MFVEYLETVFLRNGFNLKDVVLVNRVLQVEAFVVSDGELQFATSLAVCEPNQLGRLCNLRSLRDGRVCAQSGVKFPINNRVIRFCNGDLESLVTFTTIQVDLLPLSQS